MSQVRPDQLNCRIFIVAVCSWEKLKDCEFCNSATRSNEHTHTNTHTHTHTLSLSFFDRQSVSLDSRNSVLAFFIAPSYDFFCFVLPLLIMVILLLFNISFCQSLFSLYDPIKMFLHSCFRQHLKIFFHKFRVLRFYSNL